MRSLDSGRIVRFDDFEFDLEALVLSRAGRTVPLQPQPSRVLAELIRAEGGAVTREHLRDTIWGDRFVEFDQALNYCIRQIRAALGDGADEPRFIETIPRRGYRFMVPIRPAAEIGATGPQGVAAATRRRPAWWVWAGVVGGALGVAGAVRQWAAAPGGRPAEATAESAARSLPEEARVAFLAGQRWLASQTTDGYRRAVERFEVVLRTDPRFEPARLGRAEGLLWIGRVDDSRLVLDSLLAESPALGHGHTVRGALALFRDWDLERAAVHLRRGAELDPHSSVAQHYLAYHRLLAGDSTGARAAIDSALALDPLSPTLQGDAGMVRYQLGHFEEAKTLCARSLSNAAPTRGALYCLWLVEAAARGPDLASVSRRLAANDGAPAVVVQGLDGSVAGMRHYLDWEASRLRARGDSGSGTALPLARVLALGGQWGAAKAAVLDGYARHSRSIIFAATDPLLRPLRADSAVARAMIR